MAIIKLTSIKQQNVSTPYDIGTAVVNRPTSNAKVLRFISPRKFSILEDAEGSMFYAGVSPGAQVVFTVLKNDLQIGTITFNQGSQIGTCTCVETIFVEGDILTIVAPTIQDSKLADLSITISAKL